MQIQLKKGRDGPSTLTCLRPDGSRTWHTLHPFFPEHDLTHLAVEHTIPLPKAFFGLVAAGWNLSDFAEPGASSRLPTESLYAERLVGLLDQERATGHVLGAHEMSELLTTALGTTLHALSESELRNIRRRRDDYVAQWNAIAAGDTITFSLASA